MLRGCHSTPKAASTPTSDEAPQAKSRYGRIGIVATGIGALAAPHILCIAGATLGIGGAGIWGCHSWLTGHKEVAIPESLVNMPRLEKVPEDVKRFGDRQTDRALSELISAQPGLLRIRELKREEAISNGVANPDIKMVIVENEEDGSVVIVLCKDGLMCPCSEPQVYRAGHRENLSKPELFPGQHEFLRTLYPDYKNSGQVTAH